jgi:hypothetical protein
VTDPDIEKRKRRRREPKGEVYLSNAHRLPTPEELRALLAEMGADDDDPLNEPAVKHVGNPVPPAHGRPPIDRTSPPVQAGHAAASSGDHGASPDPMNVPGPRALALGHPDMRQSTTVSAPLATLRSFNGGLDDDPGRDITHSTGMVSISRLDLAAAAGLPSAPGNPVARRADHISRDSATPSNGSHVLGDSTSHAVTNKNAWNREVMLQATRDALSR